MLHSAAKEASTITYSRTVDSLSSTVDSLMTENVPLLVAEGRPRGMNSLWGLELGLALKPGTWLGVRASQKDGGPAQPPQ